MSESNDETTEEKIRKLEAELSALSSLKLEIEIVDDEDPNQTQARRESAYKAHMKALQDKKSELEELRGPLITKLSFFDKHPFVQIFLIALGILAFFIFLNWLPLDEPTQPVMDPNEVITRCFDSLDNVRDELLDDAIDSCMDLYVVEP